MFGTVNLPHGGKNSVSEASRNENLEFHGSRNQMGQYQHTQ